MRAENKDFFSWDALEDGLEKFVPRDPLHFAVHCRAQIGTSGSDGSDAFDFTVCTPRWLADNFNHPRLTRWKYESDNLLYGHRLVLMDRWDYDELNASVDLICADAVGPDWLTIGNRVSRWLPWEFDYRFDEELAEVGFPKKPSDET
jgi:hypothetical protein